jgi:aminopeptidase-like protein
VVSYSTPLRRRVPLAELRAHLHSLPDRPDWVPYRTSYYHESWGFCVSERQRAALTEPEYEVCIDATLAPGSLCYGEWLLPGRSAREILISVHVCHPSLCNDNLSGIAVAAWLAKRLRDREREYSHRFLFAPGTIGAITWLARNRDVVERVRGGLVLSSLGGAAPLVYKRSFRGDAGVDRVAAYALRRSGQAHELVDFTPWGYDERQFNSPGFRLDVGSLSRGRHGSFPGYHSSADDLSAVSGERLAESLGLVREILRLLDENTTRLNLVPHGEPQLGRRGIYRALGGDGDPKPLELACLWLLACSDGDHDLVATAERSGLDFDLLARAAGLLEQHGLLEPLEDSR